MNKLSFLGETPTIALRKAQEECGEDAIVISTKKIANANGLNKDMYEIVVAIEDEETKKNLVYTKSAITKANENQEAIKAQVYDFKEEILKMQQLLEQVQKSIWNPKSQLFDLTIPPEFAPMYDIFEKNEFDQEMTYTIMKKTIKQLPISLKSNPNKINDFFKLILRRVIPIKHEVPLRPQQRKIIMMVGPTGVGKTTTISKLAARYAYKLGQNYKVGIVTLDSFRVGAVEQLQAYTNIMRLPLEVVKKPDDLAEALLRLKDCNYIFIDTAGSSQYDIDKIELINDYQKKVEELPIEKILVLPANVKHSDLLEIYKNYSILDIDYLTFTKLDETRSFGNLISFAHKTKKSITYFSIGQNVPDDLIVSDATYLIDCFMNQECARK
ncbi:flagellar biosynthesis protein FlhF [Aliarcobacter butzleri]|uniref:flagellar biosynthesis protein FlhF n=1 Tax=Aliarcobacter butzleri TaxID=28197 RepID=UPI00063AD819|nr:flagellar biosynthesis protein FlhF [Aliarcobacter butzleri]KLE10967.1 flagellar biosynthesis protein FlhF [Aliarcobacter butzleri L354]MCG3654540.1 flagellar biosynthesis protein FlhF [Aliarcobacter butzleri]MCG3695565.1 flagellar biosynthesis protein FlhF [Aliarcobacter butzleri]MDN5073054.1 flagellar biosynthesis protein FlhF [Aliarcobacter butzleri]MDN5121952.1 flagellar biosynthesis protein FlhF [Aliarcobacter butzleri]